MAKRRGRYRAVARRSYAKGSRMGLGILMKGLVGSGGGIKGMLNSATVCLGAASVVNHLAPNMMPYQDEIVSAATGGVPALLVVTALKRLPALVGGSTAGNSTVLN